ncbi:MAG: DUF2478 domain-containing protein [Xanthobacteraceae bacterium]
MFDAQCDVAALVYEAHQQPDGVLRDFVADVQEAGLRPVGLIQSGHHDIGAVAMPALMIHSGARVDLFQDAAAYSRGRRLDLDRLTAARAEMTAAIDRGADVLIVNRFGRQEQQGRGLARLIEHALAADVPVVVPVPAFRFGDWIAYVEGMCVKLPCDGAALRTWWNGLSHRDGRARRPIQHNVCEVLK